MQIAPRRGLLDGHVPARCPLTVARSLSGRSKHAVTGATGERPLVTPRTGNANPHGVVLFTGAAGGLQ